MGADFYETSAQIAKNGCPPLGIGDGTRIDGAIVDKNCRIGRNVVIQNERGIQSSPDSDQAMICDGIVVVPKDGVLPDGWRMPS